MNRSRSSARFAPPPRRRGSRAPILLLLSLLGLVALLVWASTRDTAVPLQTKEIDVTNALPRR